MKTSILILFIAIVLVPLASFAEAIEVEDRANTVRNFISAFNAQDIDAMTALVTEDVRWNYINRSAMSTELEGKEALASSMREYFASCPTCRSDIRGMTCSVERVSVVEVASWEGSHGRNAQASMAVYEFMGSLIQAVYYFPEETKYPNQVFEGTCDD
ncbi:MAG: nuclear transport factor 2 family protein [Pseudomonadota bacterium]